MVAYLVDGDVVAGGAHLLREDGGQLRGGDVALLGRDRGGVEGTLWDKTEPQMDSVQAMPAGPGPDGQWGGQYEGQNQPTGTGPVQAMPAAGPGPDGQWEASTKARTSQPAPAPYMPCSRRASPASCRRRSSKTRIGKKPKN